MKILVIDDEPSLTAFLKEGLEEFEHKVTTCNDSEIGEILATSGKFDIVILDINMPGITGFDIIRSVRTQGIQCPILVLSAMASILDKEEGFEAGADDYLVKPFEFRELLLRIKNLSKRSIPGQAPKQLKLSDLVLDLNLKNAKRNQREISLTNREFDLLKYLFQNQGRVVSRAEIAENVWGQSFDTGTNTIDVYINFLRRKIDTNAKKKLLHTVVGMGYLLRE
ncbi:response regulator transcription factor [Jiulongibacter sediminis]|uniref:response regulator transcription factor n=1 Tax=Jiulongibacter sediminis TaxID=1605367 RepID=UPI0026EBE525|nr:response regulator transcription factor [Jiulongibacter sediminis]